MRAAGHEGFHEAEYARSNVGPPMSVVVVEQDGAGINVAYYN